MAHTNRVRVVLGGLLAGVVINVVEFVTNGVVLKADWGQAMQALGKPAVWIYAAIRTRYGAGPSTAARAGVVTWGLAVLLANVANYPLGLLPTRLLVITAVVALFEMIIAAVLGAWLYREDEASAVRRAAA
jgi:hypothetical protein